MFTGIIEAQGTVRHIVARGTNQSFELESELASQLKIDQSLAHNGVCLTVEAVADDLYSVTAVQETLKKTTLGDWSTGQCINLERSLAVGARLDGHFVQGHVDAVGTCVEVSDKGGSWELRFRFDEAFASHVVEKGSIALNGISLTIFNVGLNVFSVAIIPYTWTHTNLSSLQPGDGVNLEFDLLGKYFLRSNNLKKRD